MIAKILDEHRRRLSRLAEKRGVAQLRKLYDQALAELERKLHALARGMDSSFSAHQLRVFIAQIRQGQHLLAKRMLGELGDISKEAQVESLRGLSDSLHRLEKHFTGADVVLNIDEAARFQGIIDGRRQSLLRAHETSMANYSAEVVTRVEDQWALSLVQNETTTQAVQRVMDTADLNFWRAERIVRTETAFAAGAANYDGMIEAGKELDDLWMQWSEYVTDDGVPRDDRVGEDSIAMNGQVAKVGEWFTFPSTMPDGESVPKSCEKMIGQTWDFPPNRPNDRSVLLPFRKSWGEPGWQWKSGRRVQV